MSLYLGHPSKGEPAIPHDIEIIPGTSGTVGHGLGLVLNYKIPASGKPVDLSGTELVFIASAGGSAVHIKAKLDITWASEPGQIVVPFSVENTRVLGAHSYLKYTLERREAAAQRLILYGQINVTKVYNNDCRGCLGDRGAARDRDCAAPLNQP